MDERDSNIGGDAVETAPSCKNCGAAISGQFCSACGQSADAHIPSILGLCHEAFGSIFSYDSRLWRTIRTLLLRPGQLTVDFVEGRRVRYLGPLQLFLWLETITFFAHRLFFETDPKIGDAKMRELLMLAVLVAIGQSVLFVRRRRKFVEHLVCTSHIWAVLMIALLALYCVLPAVGHVFTHLRIGVATTYVAIVVTFAYTALAFARVYREAVLISLIKAAFLLAACAWTDAHLARVLFGRSLFF